MLPKQYVSTGMKHWHRIKANGITLYNKVKLILVWDNLQARLQRLIPHSFKNSLIGKLLGLMLAGIVVVYLVAISSLWFIASHIIDESLQKQAVQWVTELDELGTPLYAAGRHKKLLQVEKHIKNFPEIVFVRYYNASGKKVLAEFGDLQAAKSSVLNQGHTLALKDALREQRQSYLFFNNSGVLGSFAHMIAPVRIRSIASDDIFDFDLNDMTENVKVVGYIEFGMDYAYYRQAFLRSVLIGSVVIALILAGFIVLGRKLIARALAPLTRLQVPLARLAKGDIDVAVSSSGDKEIAAISEALNTTIAALKERDKTLRRMAERDSLTDLCNRAYFSASVEQAVTQFAAGGETCALLFIDLDQFKYVNDALGHAAGDRLLVQVAGLLKERLREGDILARFGGDEFTVLAKGVDRHGAKQIASSINTIMKDYCFIEGKQKFNVYCSIGVTMIDSQRYGAEEFMAQADMACYAAKSSGRNRCHCFDEASDNNKSSGNDIGWAQRIKDVLRENSLQLYYQPIISMTEQGMEYYEVLLRMPGENNEIILPDAFLPVAERFGLLTDIDYWVIEHAIESLAAHRAQNRDMTFSINLSGQVFEDAALVDVVKENLARYQVPASAIIIEITEQVAVRHMDKACGVILQLTELGCRFALDDFGVGFSSFNYLKRLPIEFIKIDGSFAEQVHKNPIDQAMVRAIIDIAQVLGKKTIIESVENRDSMRLLKKYGADYLQGRYLGEPLCIPEQQHLRTVSA